MKDGRYAADDTGYVMSLVNFDYTLIDIPELASSSNETLEWERNADLMPDEGDACLDGDRARGEGRRRDD